MDTAINVGLRVHEDYDDRKKRGDKLRRANMGRCTTSLAAQMSRSMRAIKSQVS